MTTTDDRDQYEDYDDDEAVEPVAAPSARTAPLTLSTRHAPAYGPDGPLADVRSEVDPDADEVPERESGHRVLHGDRVARTERMIWRNAFLGLYVLSVLGYAVWAL